MEYLVHPQDGMIDQNCFIKCLVYVCGAECSSLCGARSCVGKMVPEPYGG